MYTCFWPQSNKLLFYFNRHCLLKYLKMTTCELICVNKTHEPIQLPDGEAVIVGRSPQTQIVDVKCSRSQIELTANYKKKEVMLMQIGSNPSVIDSKEIEKGKSAKVKSGDIVYVLAGLYPHIIKFKKEQKVPKSKSSASISTNLDKVTKAETNSRKRRASNGHETVVKKRKTDDKKNNDSDDEKHLKSVSERLKQMQSVSTTKTVGFNIGEKKSIITEEKYEESKDVKMATDNIWTQTEKLHIFTSKGVKSSKKIASFDIDGTIITTKSGNVFAKDTGDWRIMLSETFGNLKKLHASGFKIVFFTNQMGVQKGKIKMEDLKKKFTYIVQKLGIPVQIFVATGSGLYRKPSSGMWKYLVQKSNDGFRISMSESFYCGDAAGRPVKWLPGRKKDFSCSDRLFALNIGLKFYTPEEYFLEKKPAPFDLPEFNPKRLSSSADVISSGGTCLTSKAQEVVVLCGYPACGKSFFSKKYMVSDGYVSVSRDVLGTWQKCVAQCSKSLAAGKRVVIDNTNADAESRSRYVVCAKKAGVPCRCFVFPVNSSLSRHNERFREMTDNTHAKINDMIMNTFKSKYTEPQKSEGFSEILKINFVPKFDKQADEDMYRQYLLDK